MKREQRPTAARWRARAKRFGAIFGVLVLLASITGVAPAAASEQPDTAHVTDALGAAGTTVWRDALQSMIDPDDFVCNPTAINFWIGDLLSRSSDDTLDLLFGTAALDWPIVYKLFFDNDDTDEFIGVDGEYTREHLKRQRDLIRFWDVPLDDVDLFGMHGSIIRDDAKMIPVVQFIFTAPGDPILPPEIAQLIVDDVQSVIENDPTIGYDWPLFSFNAVAFGPDPLKVVMGDGLIQFFEEIGLADNGVDLVYAHEVAHQVQGYLGEFGPPLPEETRRTELMADAFATYYLVHARGAAYNADRAMDAVELSFIAGDCNFGSPGHHGTPNQREAAAEWGAEMAQERPRGKIRSATDMVLLFDAVLPDIVAPDAP
ncbi:MAG: hypothetical protein ACR2P0_18480 [Acidimicrobiales bacterium]